MIGKGIFLPMPNDLLDATKVVASSMGMTVEAYITVLVIKALEEKRQSAIPLEERIAKQMVHYGKKKLVPLIGRLLGFKK